MEIIPWKVRTNIFLVHRNEGNKSFQELLLYDIFILFALTNTFQRLEANDCENTSSSPNENTSDSNSQCDSQYL